MADQNDTPELDLSDDDAERLLADAVDEQDHATDDQPSREQDTTDWKAEAEKWKRLSRKNEKSFTDTAARLKQFEDQGKTDSQRLQEDRDTHRTRADKAEFALKRREVAEDRAPEHATVAQIRAVAKRLSGDTDEALEKDADELLDRKSVV